MEPRLLALINSLRMRFAIWFFRIFGKIKLFQLKYLLRIKKSTLHLIELQLRDHFFPVVLEGDDEKTDRIVGLSTLYLIHWEPVEQVDIPDEEKTQARSIASSANAVHDLADSLSTFLGLQKLIYEVFGKSSPQGIERLTQTDFPVLPKELSQKDLYRTSNKVRRKIKNLRRAMSDRKGERINLDFSSVGQVLSLFSICFLLTGYLYSSIFLSHFGIASSHYFTISDYLASSVDKAESSLLAIVGALIGMGVGLLHRSRMSEAQVRVAQQNNPEWLWNTTKLMFIGGLVWWFFENREEFYRLLPIAAVYLLIDSLIHISKRYFHQPVKAMFVLSFVSLYGLAFFSGVRLDLEQVKTGSYWKKHSETLTLTPDMTLDASNLLLLYSSGQYFFLIQKDSGTPIVIPREKVIQVEINRPFK